MGDKDFSLTQKGEERAKKLFESQPCGEKSSEPVPPAELAPPPQKEEVKVEPQQPQPCVEKVPEPKLAVEERRDWYALTQEQLTEQHYDVLNKVFSGEDVDPETL